ncbi:hypothetical protein Syun_010328 [Stephania yunnanensis]|uniref:Terpene synthase N-terminal domain-containing protein n=1 Tax=Stephania yunnanensis TaxID=152371 RepID=A0AAP0PRJ4_9MAGN
MLECVDQENPQVVDGPLRQAIALREALCGDRLRDCKDQYYSNKTPFTSTNELELAIGQILVECNNNLLHSFTVYIFHKFKTEATGSNHGSLKNIIRKEPLDAESPEMCMTMIDALQNLVVDYHFQEEITIALTRQCRAIVETSGRDVFNKFMDKDGKFKMSSTKEDVRGMLSLYEAADFGIEGEDSLQNVKVLIVKQLHTSLETMEHDLAKLVEYTLECPSQKRLPRFMTKQYTELYEKIGRKNDVLLEFAKMDFNAVQALHKKELVQVLRWLKDLGLAEELEFARNQPVKWFTWSMASWQPFQNPVYRKRELNSPNL